MLLLFSLLPFPLPLSILPLLLTSLFILFAEYSYSLMYRISYFMGLLKQRKSLLVLSNEFISFVINSWHKLVIVFLFWVCDKVNLGNKIIFMSVKHTYIEVFLFKIYQMLDNICLWTLNKIFSLFLRNKVYYVEYILGKKSYVLQKKLK